MFNWEDMRFFNAFVSAGSLSAAARKLGVDHVTVARRISSLEASLGLKLVDRRHRTYVLTENGQKVAQFSEKIDEHACAIGRFAGAEQSAVEGDVIVATLPAFAGMFIAPYIGRLYKSHPGLRVSLLVTKEALSLSRREADIKINFERPSESAVVVRRLGAVRFALYGNEAYLSSGEPYTFIGYDETTPDTPQQEFLKKQAEGHPVIFFSNDLRVQAVSVAGNAGIALLPEYLAREFNLKESNPAGPVLMQDIWLSVHKDVRDSKRIRTVINFLTDCIKSAYTL
ncbi:LysR family transcriptional regulator [Dickeya dianthicola]|uniref:LysR family transcriptional regulator n=1 Tax=Dickeya dianthicola TaxID=204039 RepID=UPI0018691698|nr:LysR family transcriptional regulator [Dickeya dianthicola]QOL14849.1 LysR family transcriptional regulator [Dickeya dianthicola]